MLSIQAMKYSSRFVAAAALFWAAMLGPSLAATAQSALIVGAGMGYGSAAHIVEHEGEVGMHLLTGPQLDFGLELGLGPVFGISLDADLMAAELGTRIAGVSELNGEELLNFGALETGDPIRGFVFGGAAMADIHLGAYFPSAGIGFVQVESEMLDGSESFQSFNCMTFVGKPMNFKAGETFSFSLEYEQTIANCENPGRSLAVSARLRF